MQTHSCLIRRAMVMAAGLGTRMRPFTYHQTKALLPVMGIPVAQFTVDSLVHAGVEQIVANAHHGGETAAKGLASLSFDGLGDLGHASLTLSDESEKLLGSAGGIKKALDFFEGEPFFLANSDVLCGVNWEELAKRHFQLRSQSGVVLTLALYPAGSPGTCYREILFDPKTHLITGLGELVEGRPYFIGAAVLEKEALSLVSPGENADFVQSILKPAIQASRAGSFLTQGEWFDIGEPKLWLRTHLDLIQLLEHRNFPSGSASQLWTQRILKENVRVSEGIWISRRSSSQVPDLSHLNWNSPCYWDAGELPAEPPQSLGPEAVLYGLVQKGFLPGRGIGFANHWIA